MTDGTLFIDKNGINDFGTKLEAQRKAHFLTDLAIIGKNRHGVFAHRIMLTTRFPHLETMLAKLPFRRDAILYWPHISTYIIESVISFAYTGKIMLSLGNVLRIYLLALNLRSSTLQMFCLNFLKQKLSLTMLEKAWIMSVYTSDSGIRSICLNCMRDHFKQFIKTPLFLRIDADSFVSLLRRVNVCGGISEEEKFNAISAWMMYGSQKERLNHSYALFETILWALISKDFLIQQLGLDTVIANYAPTRCVISEALRRLEQGECLYVVGRNGVRLNRSTIIQYNPRTNEEISIGHLPYRPFACITKIQDSIFLIGGATTPSTQADAFQIAQQFTHKTIPPMKCARMLCAAASSIFEVIVCGGCISDKTRLRSCEIYLYTQKRWIYAPELNAVRCSHCAIWMPDGRLFALGGVDQQMSLSSVEMYHRSWDSADRIPSKWRYVAPMLSSRNKFGAVLMHDCIVVAGGYVLKDAQCINRVEIFVPPSKSMPEEMGQWTLLKQMSSELMVYSTVVLDDEIYVFGNDKTILKLKPPPTNPNMPSWFWNNANNKGIPNSYWMWENVPPLTSVNAGAISAVLLDSH